MKRYDTEQDILPLVAGLTGLSEQRVEKALAELDKAGFIRLDNMQDGRVGITLCDLSQP